MRAAPIPTRSRSNTTSGVPASRPSNAPSHIALPAAPHSSSWTNNAFAAFGNGGGSVSGSARGSPGTPGSAPGTPFAEIGASSGTPGRGTESRTDQQRPVTSPTSPRAGFLPNFIQRTRARSSTLSGRRNQGQANPPQNVASQGLSSSQSGNQAQGAMAAPNGVNGSSGSRRATPVLTRSVSTPQQGFTTQLPSAVITTTEADRPPAGPTFRIRLVPHLETYRSLHFEPVVRDLQPCSGPDRFDGTVLKVGRFTEKQSQALQQQQQQQGAGTNNVAHSQALSAALRDATGAGGQEVPAFTAGIDGDPAFNPFTFSNTDPAAPTVPPAAPAAGGNNLTSTVLVNGFPLTGERPATGMGGGGHLTSAKVAFKSKVVSRAHAEIWCEAGGKFFVRDTKSSSGTFLNHIRLSNPNTESRPYPIKDGDIVQLGVDYQGGTEEMYRCVKMKIEVGREKSREAMKQLRALGGVPESPSAGSAGSNGNKEKKVVSKASVTDCCICLFSRTFHDLEADVEVDDAWEVASRRASLRRESAQVADVDMTHAVSPSAQSVNSPMVVDTPGMAPDSPDDPSMTDAAQEPSRSINSDVPFPETEDAVADAADADSPVTGRTMSLGGLPIPRFNETNPNPEYAGLDAATPMNTTFLSTLAESPLGANSLTALGGVVRASVRLDDVGEEETDDVRLREPADQLYT
ncbi:hypothetical protein QFC21_001634 [Naganishia friedmannii]|uniref:Uncharacterized protein n=1 Tax=Naganishia friedmannii TaxID=89922 RepID=A0ACC2W2E2_9TREE|nr:hypothetical protein QFC21_001634 [Naganishia friedmannii]